MITILYGKDDFSVHEALASLKSELDSDGMLAEAPKNIQAWSGLSAMEGPGPCAKAPM